MGNQNNEEIEIDITKAPDEQGLGDEDIVIQDSHESESDSDESAEEDKGEKSTPPSKKGSSKNKSNWNKMSEAKKAAEKKAAELQAEIDRLKSGSDDSDEGYDDYDEPSYDKSDLLEFMLENDDAKEHKAGIIEALNEFPGISFEKALKLAKVSGPEESKSYNDFSSKSSEVVRTKKLKDLTREEAVNNLSIEQFAKWDELSSKKSSNPFG